MCGVLRDGESCGRAWVGRSSPGRHVGLGCGMGEQEEEELRQSTECCLLVEGVAPLHACMRVSVGAEHYAAVDSPSAAALCRPAPPWMLLQVMLTHDTPLPSRSSP